MKKECVLYDRECTNCGECDMCDLDPKKKCNNCGACLESDGDYSTVDVDLSYEEENSPELLSYEEMFPEKAFIGENAWDDEDDDLDSESDFDDDFDNPDNFYEDEYFDDYDEPDDEDQLRKDFGELF